MPWKYLRITRRCTCDRPFSEEEEMYILAAAPVRAAAFFAKKKAAHGAAFIFQYLAL